MSEKEKVSKISFFKDLTDDELKIISKICEEETYEKGDIIFEENSPSDRFYFIIKGQVTISQSLGKDGQDELVILNKDECFGEMSWIDGGLRSATAIAEDASELLTIKMDSIDSLMNHNSTISTKILKHFCIVLSSRLRDANKQISDMSGLFISFRTSKK